MDIDGIPMDTSELKDEEIKATIIRLIDANIKRTGVDKLKDFLEKSDFYTAPASTQFHGNFDGGLARHVLQVYQLLLNKTTEYSDKLTEGKELSLETIVIIALFHDLCKVNFYKKTEGEPATEKQMSYFNSLINLPEVEYRKKLGLEGQKMITKRHISKLIDHLKNGGSLEALPMPEAEYQVDEHLPLGHGEKSVYMLSKLIELTDEEAIAIRWHMIAFEAGTHFDYPTGFPFRQAVKEYPLVTLLFTADYEASNIFNT